MLSSLAAGLWARHADVEPAAWLKERIEAFGATADEPARVALDPDTAP